MVIVGRVVDPDGNGVEGATVACASGGVGTSNDDGYYSIADVAPAERIVLRFAAAGYVGTTGIGRMTASDKTTVNAITRVRAAGQPVDGIAGGVVAFSQGVVTIPAGAITDPLGKPYQGSAMVHVTPVDVQDIGVRAAPGDFSATSASGLLAQLETFSMGSFELRDQAGNTLQIAAGAQVGVEMLLPAHTTLVAGEVLPAWHFDNQTGLWVEQGSGSVGPSSTDPTRLSYKTKVGQFSDWSCDRPYETTCVSGTITSACDGKPVGADLRAGGLTYNGSSNGIALDNGQYCMPVKKGSRVRITASSGSGASRVVKSVDVASGDAVSKCPGPCTIQDIELPCTSQDNNVDCGDDAFAGCKSCLQGRVVDSSGNPVVATLKVKTGVNSMTAITDASGRYCTPAALGAPTTIVASARGGTSTVTKTANTPGACPVCEQVADIVVSDPQGSDLSLDFSGCPKDVGGVTIHAVQANGTAPALATLDAAWLDASQSSTGRYVLSFDVVSSKNIGTAFAPQARFELDLPAAPVIAGVYEVKTAADSEYRMHGQAASCNGAPAGLSSESFRLETYGTAVGSGWIKLDQGFANAGDRVKGSFALSFGADCAASRASLNIQASFDSILRDSASPTTTDPATTKIGQCSRFDQLSSAIASNSQGLSTGAVQVVVDGTPMVDKNALITSQYLWITDQMKISYFGDGGYFSATVDHPTGGVNKATGASLSLRDRGDCYMTMKAGTVTIPSFGGADATRWVTGSFANDFEYSPDGSGSNSVPVKATGQFGGPVCAGY
jgi:hypothetical protein